MVNKFHWPKGGSETYHFGLAEGLRSLGHKVFFFSMRDDRNVPCEQSGYFVSARDYNGPSSLAQKLSAATSLIYSKEARDKFDALLREVRPHAIHLNLVHRQITLSILDAPYLKEHRVPVVYTAHDYILVCPGYLMLDGEGEVCDDCLRGTFLPCIQKRCVKSSRSKSALAAAEARFLRLHHSYDKVDLFIAPSLFMRDKLLEGGFDPERVIHMQNFATDEVLTRASSTEDFTDRERPFLLFSGRLSREKGVDILVRAFLRVAEAEPDWRLFIAGDGPERPAIEAMLTPSPHGERVELVGHLSQAEVQRYAERASLAIASSRCRENMPYSVIEALAAGTPVVGTRIGGIPELVMEGETGFVAEPGDEQSLYEAIVRGIVICRDVGSYREMQRRCRAYVLNHCDQRTYVKKLVSLYGELIETKAGRVSLPGSKRPSARMMPAGESGDTAQEDGSQYGR